MKISKSITSVLAAKLGLLELLHLSIAVGPANDGTGFLGLELRDLNLALPVFVFAGLLHAVVALLDEVERLGHVLAVLHQLFKLALLLIDLVDCDLSLLDILLLLGQTGILSSLVLSE